MNNAAGEDRMKTEDIKRLVDASYDYCLSKMSGDDSSSLYSIKWLVDMFSGSLLKEMNLFFKRIEKQQADLVDFVRVILELIEYDAKDSIFVVICAIDMFKRITEVYGLHQFISFKDVTNFMIDVSYCLRVGIYGPRWRWHDCEVQSSGPEEPFFKH